MANDSRLKDFPYAKGEFEDLLEDARMAADNDRAEEFVAKAKENFKAWGDSMFWSVKQDNWLNNIATGD